MICLALVRRSERGLHKLGVGDPVNTAAPERRCYCSGKGTWICSKGRCSSVVERVIGVWLAAKERKGEQRMPVPTSTKHTGPACCALTTSKR